MTDQVKAGVTDPADVLAPHRDRLDAMDEQILGLLTARMRVCLDIARLKARHGIPMMQPERVGLVVARARAHAAAHGLPEEFLADVFQRVIDETCAREDALIAELTREESR
ncbi:chorismate mutase [Streptomyces sp. NPDC047017]|uniref:chorismate mutase n=1 Tax=Streptomyces sp. NPDC047017 TaxID=3155024 RepID=UPI00340B4125